MHFTHIAPRPDRRQRRVPAGPERQLSARVRHGGRDRRGRRGRQGVESRRAGLVQLRGRPHPRQGDRRDQGERIGCPDRRCLDRVQGHPGARK